MTLKTFDISKFVIPNSLSFKYQVYMSSDCKDTGTLKLEFEASVQFCLLLEPKTSERCNLNLRNVKNKCTDYNSFKIVFFMKCTFIHES